MTIFISNLLLVIIHTHQTATSVDTDEIYVPSYPKHKYTASAKKATNVAFHTILW
jgi:hypothetical protein